MLREPLTVVRPGCVSNRDEIGDDLRERKARRVPEQKVDSGTGSYQFFLSYRSRVPRDDPI